jgi:hypothetical protein
LNQLKSVEHYNVCVLSNDDPPVADRVGVEIEELLGLLE